MKDLENIKGSRVYGRRLSKPLKKRSETRLREYLPKYSISIEGGQVDLKKLFGHDLWK